MLKSKTAARIGVLSLLLVLLLLAHTRSAYAQSKVYFWQSFDVLVTVQEDGSLLVTEQQTLEFSGAPFTFGFRNIPINSYGRNDGITDVSVREGEIQYQESSSQSEYTFYTTTSGNELTIYWYFPPAIGTQVYTISYRVLGGVAVDQGTGQVFWNAMPANLGAPINAGRMGIQTPAGAEIIRTTAQVGGSENAGISTQVAESGREVLFTLTQPRPAGVDVEVGAHFPIEGLSIATPDWQRSEQVRDVLSLVVLLVSGFIIVAGPTVILLWWYLRGRDPELTTPAPAYLAEPPDDTPPAVVGTLVDERAQIHDVVSTLIDLSRRGYMTMKEEKKDFLFERTDKDASGLRPFEQKTLKAVFGRSDSKRLNSLKYKFSSKLPEIHKELYDELVKAGFASASPEAARGRYGCLGAVLFGVAVLVFFLSFTIGNALLSTALCPAFALGITAITLIVVGQHMPRKTRKGAEAAANWLAFKKYLEEIERHADLGKSGEIFEKYLAYAVVFGLERTWIRKFSQTPGTPVPHWYYPVFIPAAGRRVSGGPAGGGGMPSLEGMSGGLTGGLESMSTGLTRMLTSTQSVMQSTKSSSSSGGGGGFSGGFSGGSSGGGGGGFG